VFFKLRIQLIFEMEIMKNRLIYTLISLMLVSLIGIISIQSIWISGAIAGRENEFSTHINDALNRLNDDIDQDEAEFFIERQFGSVDSLVHDIVIIEGDSKPKSQERRIIINKSNSNDVIIDVQNTDGSEDSFVELHRNFEEINGNINDWKETIELKLKNLDSTLEEQIHMREFRDAKTNRITSMVEHFTFEKLLNGEIKDRISSQELKKKLKKALKKEGIHSGFDFAVYNIETATYEKGYVSKGFDKKQEGTVYSKTLFPSDKMKESRFNLIVQYDNQSGYVWDGVQQMAILSGIFTILILISFGYALYFIFKQKKISQIKTDFINNMTHELKTPLASISLASSSIKHPEIIGKPEEIRKYTTIIENEKDRINSHIERVLDIATLDKGDLKLDFNIVDLVPLIQSSIHNVDLSLAEIGGSCNFKTELDSALIDGDEFHLINVVTNILDNSIKYHNNNLKIDVALTENGSNYAILISDNGIGMSQKEQKQAFDKFYRAETGNIHNRKGFGLGLSYVKGIVQQHNGTAKIESQKGAGTTLTVVIPSNHE
jgi:two-component system phosphate regulon sensor histidine kinase PhoR